jgi:hypothetical protein
VYKVAWIARFHPDLTKEEGHRRWADVHGPLAAAIPGLERYVQSHVVGGLPRVSGVAQEEPQFDGYSCGWWADRAAFEASMGTPEWAAMVQDGDGLWDRPFLTRMSGQVEEVPMIEGPSSPCKAVWVVRFRPGMTREEGRAYWRTVHGPIFAGLDIDRYLQNHVVGPIAEPGSEVGFDGFSECWFQDEDALQAAITSAAWAEAREDGPRVFDVTRLWGAVLEDVVVKDSGVVA